MIERHFPERDPSSVTQATLNFLIREVEGQRQVLLGMKKRGFGEGLWNGLGGKISEGERDILAAVREIQEEIGVFVPAADIEKVGLLHFYFPDEPDKADWNQDVHVFLVDDWMGVPRESEEMKPEWFSVDSLPFDSMWDDDSFWLPKVLSGEKIEGWFSFDGRNKVLNYNITELKQRE